MPVTARLDVTIVIDEQTAVVLGVFVTRLMQHKIRRAAAVTLQRLEIG